MFSFFAKKRPPAPTTVHPALEAQLVKEESLPNTQQSLTNADFPLHCQKVRVGGKQVFLNYDPETMDAPIHGYLVEGKDIQNPLIFINNTNYLKSTELGCGLVTEDPHCIKVLSFSDEFREDFIFWRGQEKIGEGIA